MSTSLLTEMQPLSPLENLPLQDGTLEVSLIIPAKNSTHTLETTVIEAHRFLSERFPESFEIILVPNPAPHNPDDHSTSIAYALEKRFSSVRVFPHTTPPGKGAAIRKGFSHSRGKWIFFTDADLPYELDFFDRALGLLKKGFDLVNGNRRLPSSHFYIPVKLLRLAYGRHKLGLAFNRLVRWIFPIYTTDTQAGIKGLSRRLALDAFSRQICPGFLFDLEIFLTAQGLNYGQAELPVTLHLNSEKSTVRIIRECVLVANWLTRIKAMQLKQRYGSHGKRNQKILSRYQNTPSMTRFFLWARWLLTPYHQMASHLPAEGRILDLGCGHGLFSLAVATRSPLRQVTGVDHDANRVKLASEAARGIPNLNLESGSLIELGNHTQPYSGIALIDVMHYFEPTQQESILKQVSHLLTQGGTLLVREVDPHGGLISSWNRFYEKIATGVGFTQADKKGLHFRSREEWEKTLQSVGFKVTSERCSSPLFADILYICERN